MKIKINKTNTYTDSFASTWIYLIIIVFSRFLILFTHNEFINIVFGTFVNVIISIFIINGIFKQAWLYFDKPRDRISSNIARIKRLKLINRWINFVLCIASIIYMIIVFTTEFTDSIVNDIICIVTLYLSIEDSNISKKMIHHYEKKPLY